jgi:hypothetical protein
MRHAGYGVVQRSGPVYHVGVRCTHVDCCRSGLDVVERDGARGEIDGSAADKSCEGGLRHTL